MAISKYERDKNIPSSGVLLRFSDALNVPVEYFFRPQSVKVTAPTYRKLASLGARDEAAIIARIEESIERYFEVESLFPDEQNDFDFKASASSLASVENAVARLREKWDLGLSPIESLTELFEEHGLKIMLVDGLKGFDACTFYANGSPVITIKKEIPGDRQRFNLAHELGHLALQVKGKLDEEKAAYRFAGAFLVPADTARQELGVKRRSLDPYELYLLKHKYGMSMQAWIYRAMDLRIISKSRARILFADFRKRGWHKNEPGEQLSSEAPRRFERLVLRALADDLISRSRAEELLGKPIGGLLPEVFEFYDVANIGTHH
jgi:Zn-dependent peptidase ImmA (M78 family)